MSCRILSCLVFVFVFVWNLLLMALHGRLYFAVFCHLSLNLLLLHKLRQADGFLDLFFLRLRGGWLEIKKDLEPFRETRIERAL